MDNKRYARLNDSGAVAVMDLGTNTFHLLIARGSAGDFEAIEHLHEAVKLGEGGINKGIIQPEAFERGIAAMRKFQHIIANNQVEQVKAIATSALRNAANGKEFIKRVKEETGIRIEIINGDKEAHYIYEGIKASGSLGDENALIMDIGGGSVEFIIGNGRQVLWKQSFEIGAARLMDKFNQTDPIPYESINALNNYLDDVLPQLFKAVENTPVDRLIGSSGAFETFAALTELRKGYEFDLKICKSYDFLKEDLFSITDEIIRSAHHERAANKGIIPVRVDMIVVASLITQYIIRKLGLQRICMSTYSLKEGVLAEILG